MSTWQPSHDFSGYQPLKGGPVEGRSISEWRGKIFNTASGAGGQAMHFGVTSPSNHNRAASVDDAVSMEDVVEETVSNKKTLVKAQKWVRFALNAVDVVILANAMMGFVLAVVSEEILWRTHEYRSVQTIVLKSIVLASTLLLILGVLARAFLKWQMLILNRMVLSGDSIFSHMSLVVTVIVEVLICAVSPLPFVNTELTVDEVTYSFDSVITVPMMLRMYLLARVLKDYSYFSTEKAKMFGKLVNIRPNSYIYTFKHLLRSSPLMFMTAINVLSILVFSYAIHIYERPISKMSSLWNSVWLTIVTMTTVGYGDLYPQTILGRLCAICAAYTAMVIGALWVVAVQEKFLMTPKESKLADTLFLLETRSKMRDQSARCIQQTFKLNRAHQNGARKGKQFKMKKQAWKYAHGAAELRTKISEDSPDNDPTFILCEGYSSISRTESRVQELERKVESMASDIAAINDNFSRLAESIQILTRAVTDDSPSNIGQAGASGDNLSSATQFRRLFSRGKNGPRNQSDS